ncbi:MAG: 4-alpha-glucanotransferase [Treponemataceae bacterium]|nr:4-alpha-glucanotransferase [Treponemataceae bacterium]
MSLPRLSGILLHPTSLPGSYGIGTLGKSAFAFVDFLERARVRLWQVLPLGPTGYGDSPYQSFSTFALNPLLIDCDMLSERGWARPTDIVPPHFIKPKGDVDFGAVVWWKMPVLRTCAEYFLDHANDADKADYAAFCKKNRYWLDDYASFMSIKTHHDLQAAAESEKKGASVPGTWNVYWKKDLAGHDKTAIAAWNEAHREEVEQYKVIQFFAAVQWQTLKAYANGKGIAIVGDIPIFVAPDSADVWANQPLFQLNKRGVPRCVAGVPPDYFSATGQLWGNPLYDWAAMKADGYQWWIARIKKQLELTDYVRIDHFRGFESYWAVPYGNPTAEQGTWKKGPGRALFAAIRMALGDLPLIAEDLGVITDAVRDLRDGLDLPGMKILQFAFDENERRAGNLVNAFLPHAYDKPCVVYTGTHDNDTTQGYLESIGDDKLALIASYVRGESVDAERAKKLRKNGALLRGLIALACSSTAQFAIIPLQDVYRLGTKARMNMPSTSGKNWSWRMTDAMLAGEKADEAAAWLAELAVLYGRNGAER